MGAKKVLPLYKIITDGVMTGTAVIESAEPTFIENQDNVGIQVDWTGTPVGTFSVLASIDGVEYHALAFNPALAQPSGSAGGFLINLNQLPFKWVKLQYTNASGAGVLTAYIYAKDLN